MTAEIKAIEYHLPGYPVSNDSLGAMNPDWPIDRIQSRTGILARHISSAGECASDLGVAAAQKLFATGACSPSDVDYVLFCTQSPDYFLPTTACLIQQRLNIPTSAGALDFNLGCSGFVYGLGIAQGLIQTGQATTILFITAETYSKYIHPRDRTVSMVFGDAAAATLISHSSKSGACSGNYVFGTDGTGAANLIVPAGASRQRCTDETGVAVCDEQGNWRSRDNLIMNGAEVFSFALRAVPECVNQLLRKAGKQITDVDVFVFHQANEYMLEHLRRKLGIPQDKFYVFLRDCANTVSSTIPIALKHALDERRFEAGQLVMLVGFGVGYSWGATLLRWPTLGCS